MPPANSFAEQELSEVREQMRQELARLTAVAARCERIENWHRSGGYEEFNEEILKPLEWAAFMQIKQPGFDPAKVELVSQLKAATQMVDEIRRKIENKITEGKNARLRILEITSTLAKEDEVEKEVTPNG